MRGGGSAVGVNKQASGRACRMWRETLGTDSLIVFAALDLWFHYPWGDESRTESRSAVEWKGRNLSGQESFNQIFCWSKRRWALTWFLRHLLAVLDANTKTPRHGLIRSEQILFLWRYVIPISALSPSACRLNQIFISSVAFHGEIKREVRAGEERDGVNRQRGRKRLTWRLCSSPR